MAAKALQLRWFAVLKSQDGRSGILQDHQDATVTLNRGVEVPGMVFWHGWSFAEVCLPTGPLPH
eukprot:1990497-Pyramimonas_sp.AAC.1